MKAISTPKQNSNAAVMTALVIIQIILLILCVLFSADIAMAEINSEKPNEAEFDSVPSTNLIVGLFLLLGCLLLVQLYRLVALGSRRRKRSRAVQDRKNRGQANRKRFTAKGRANGSPKEQPNSRAIVRRSAIHTLNLKNHSDLSQDGFVGQTLANPIVIFVETEQGKKVTGVPIRFEVSQGGGMLQNHRSVAWVKTGKKGVAKIGWKMGRQVGPQKLHVSILNDKHKTLEFVSFARPVVSETMLTSENRDEQLLSQNRYKSLN
ncbi:hypothetical protein GWO43_31480 [candidate division KSB1 bacterium]|nr:hypothetical protein [candidate division KSB1 bacterium]NIR73432.1 hypothetical protein [candidate division KSB1 bacterium]NIS28423.1 hypothetical protein [candidate division KSB1 bacterium]NIT75303.1 hypothetical protein [candidate division KSB1 bacterium]NIU29151.1 hypothetical protein [candidate division KSB1 bacterium]